MPWTMYGRKKSEQTRGMNMAARARNLTCTLKTCHTNRALGSLNLTISGMTQIVVESGAPLEIRSVLNHVGYEES
jgi:hypothetical protein